MLLPDWKRRLDQAIAEDRELRLQTRRAKVFVIAVHPERNQLDVAEFANMAAYVKHADEIEEYFERRRTTK